MHKNLDEFKIIEKYFKQKTLSRADVLLSIGDDGALLKAPAGQILVVSIDTLVEGTHFLPDCNPYDIGFKALAVNLSDLAAMGAKPAWMTLALTMPKADPEWLEKFSEGLFDLANQFHVELVGGDTTKGPLSVTIQAHGFVSPEQELRRSGACVGDKIYVSGTLGDAGLGLQVLLGKRKLPEKEKQYVLQHLYRPFPQIKLGLLLHGLASSAIDISDGLLADLGHILEASHVGAELIAQQIPISSVLMQSLSFNDAMQLALTAGDDYELCFTVPPEKEKALLAKLQHEQIPYYCIGEIKSGKEISIRDFFGELPKKGFQHF